MHSCLTAPTTGDKQLAILCHVPKALQDATPEFKIKEWVEAVTSSCGGTIESETDEIIKAVAPGNPEKEMFPLKMRDAAQVCGSAAAYSD